MLHVPYLLFFLLSNIYFGLLFSKTRQHLRCNLLFGLISYFGLLKDANISFFLSNQCEEILSWYITPWSTWKRCFHIREPDGESILWIVEKRVLYWAISIPKQQYINFYRPFRSKCSSEDQHGNRSCESLSQLQEGNFYF